MPVVLHIAAPPLVQEPPVPHGHMRRTLSSVSTRRPYKYSPDSLNSMEACRECCAVPFSYSTHGYQIHFSCAAKSR